MQDELQLKSKCVSCVLPDTDYVTLSLFLYLPPCTSKLDYM